MSKQKGTALVTGGAKRIGKAICLSLASSGYNIALHYNRSKKDAEQVAQTIQNNGGSCKLFCCELSDLNSVEKLINDVHDQFNDFNVLINNASMFEPSTIKASDPESLLNHFNVNFNAPYILTGRFAQTCSQGNIINILDTNIAQQNTQYAAYLLSKKALYELTKQSAVELAPHIRVNAVAPGLILPSEHTNEDHMQRMTERVPTKTRGAVEQIPFCIQYLLNNEYITGQVIFNDGGEHLV